VPQKDLHKLLERIHLRLDESSVGISHQLAHLEVADLAELLNQLLLAEAATVISMLPVARVIELSIIQRCAAARRFWNSWSRNGSRKYWRPLGGRTHGRHPADGSA